MDKADGICVRSASQTERIELIKVALRNKIGEGGRKHYGIDEEVTRTPPASSRTTLGLANGGATVTSTTVEDGGMYL